MLSHDPGRSGRSEITGPDDASVRPPWPFRVGAPIASAPAIDANGTAYFGADDGLLYGVTADAAVRPLVATGGPIRSGPAISLEGAPEDGDPRPGAAAAIYVGSDDSSVYAISSTGTPKWDLVPGTPANASPIRSSPVVAKDPGSSLTRVYVGADNGRLYAIFETGASSATTVWEFAAAAPLSTSAGLSPSGDVVHITSPDSRLHFLDARVGSTVAGPVSIGQGLLTAPMLDADGNVYVGTEAGELHSYDRLGQVRSGWPLSLGAPVQAAAAIGAGGEILVLARGRLAAVSDTGQLLWNERLTSAVGSTPPVVDDAGTAYVASSDGWMFAVTRLANASGSRLLWAVEVSPRSVLTTPALDALGRVYVGSSDGGLYVIDETPAFKLAFQSDLFAQPNVDVYSLRHAYAAHDPRRTLRLTDDAAAERQPAFSLDPRVMAYVSDRDGSDDVFIANGMGADEQNLTAVSAGAPFTATSAEIDPAFTPLDPIRNVSRLPDGRAYVAFTSDAPGTDRLLFADVTTGGTRVLSFTDWASAQFASVISGQLEPPDSSQSQVAFSPDGTMVAYRHCDEQARVGALMLLVLDGDRSQLLQVGPPIAFDEATQACPDLSPSFAPDGHWLVRRDGARLAVHDVRNPRISGAPVRFSINGPRGRDPLHPAWAPDGSAIAIGALTRSGTVDLFLGTGSNYASFARLTRSDTSD